MYCDCKSDGIGADSKPNRPWEGWEYRVLAEGHGHQEAARLLGRDADEVERVHRGFAEATFLEWYRERRCRWAPQDGGVVRRLGYKIWEEDFPDVITEEQVENEIIDVLGDCFVYFDQTAGNQVLTDRSRFLWYFIRGFRRRLRKRRKEEGRRRRKLRTTRLDKFDPAGSVTEGRDYELFKGWSRRLLRLALGGFDRLTREVVILRHVCGLPAEEVASLLGLPRGGVYARSRPDRVAERVRKGVQRLVLGWPGPYRDEVIRELHVEGGFGEREIAGLLCVPNEVVAAHLRMGPGLRRGAYSVWSEKPKSVVEYPTNSRSSGPICTVGSNDESPGGTANPHRGFVQTQKVGMTYEDFGQLSFPAK